MDRDIRELKLAATQNTRERDYWLNILAGEPAKCAFPYDYTYDHNQAEVQSPGRVLKEMSMQWEVEEPFFAQLMRLCKENHHTLHIILLAILTGLLNRYSGSEDIITATPIYRQSEDIQYINTILPLRIVLENGISFKQLLGMVKQNILEGITHQAYPIELLPELLNLPQPGRGFPLFDTALVLENIQPYEYLEHIELSMVFKFSRTPHAISITIIYDAQLYRESTIRQIINHYTRFMQNALASPAENISNIEILSETEKKQLLIDFNDTAADYPRDKTIQQLFAEQVAQTPDYVALHGCMIAWMDGGMDAGMHDAWMHDCMDACMDGGMDAGMHDCMDAWMHGGMDAGMHDCMDAWMDGGMDAGMHDCMDAWMDGGMDAWMHGEVETLRATSLQYQYQITYRQLNEQSNRLAGVLIEKGVLPDDIVAIMMERSIDLITAILGVLKAGGAYLPIDPGYPQERIDYMLKDSKAKLTINSEFLKEMPRASHQHSAFIVQHSNHLCYIIYTSGSTGKPKGVVVTHRNVVRLVKNTNFVPLSQETRILQTGAPVFDATTFEIWGSLLNGGQLVLVNKEVILDAQQLKPELIKHSINTLWLSAPLFNQLQQQDNELFVSLHYLLVGGDILSPGHINQVKRRFPALKIINGYGPTENTTFSTTYEINKEYNGSIPIGKPIANSTAYILDKAGNLVPVGVWGELVVGGDGVSLGYLNNPELTAEKFRPLIKLMPQISLMKNKNNALRADLNAFGEEEIFQHSVFILNGRPRRGLHHSAFITQHSMLYCTGDLARWLPAGPPTGGASGGVIDFLGRIDQQVKIRGFRIELEEIQNQLLTHEAIKEAVVIARTTRGGDKYLCAYFVPSNKVTQPDSDELKKYLALRLPDYMIPSYIITLPELPLNRNGKIDRHLLPEPFEKTQESHIPPRDKMEEELVTMFADVLDINAEQIGINTNFFKNGGHSLKAVILIAKIHRVFHAAVSLSQVFKNPTIEKLAQFIKTAQFDKYTSIPAVEKKEYYPLSPIQRRFYILYAMQGVDTAFNLPESVIIEGLLDPDQLEKAVQMLIERHETLRTSFTIVNGEAVQVVHECVEFHIDRLKADEKNLQELVVSFMQPFDLKKAPLLRVKWVKIENFKSLLYIETHHILSDGTSQSIMIRDLLHLYGNKKLPSLRIQYKDVAVWQTSQEGQTFTAKYEKYWLNQFKDKVPTLNLFTDFPRPALQSFKGNHIYFTLAGDVYREIMLLKEKTGTTLFTILLTTLNILLFKYTGNEDIVIGTPVAGRHDPEMENVLGVFINPLALRNKPNRDKKLAEFLNEVKENTLAAFENQAFPFDDLIEKTGIKRDTKRNPFFDIDLVLLNMNKPHWEIEGLTITNYPCGQDITQMDIAFYVSEQQVENGMQIDFILFYCTDLFTRETMERFAGHFKAILQILLENKDIYLKDIQISYQLEKTQTNAYDSLEDF